MSTCNDRQWVDATHDSGSTLALSLSLARTHSQTRSAPLNVTCSARPHDTRTRSRNLISMMSLSLKHIPCPAGNACTAFQCIFGHERDEKPQSPASASQIQGENVNDQGAKAATKGAENDSDGAQLPVNPKPDTITRPVSPPPLKRPASRNPTASSPPQKKLARREHTNTTAAPSKGDKTAAAKPTGPTAQSTPSLATKAKVTAAKPESLNPRLLKHSPASHETRVKLLRMLHAEYERLNKELKADANDEEEKLVFTEQELIQKALTEEQAIAIEKASVYANVMKNKVMSYKRMKVPQWKEELQRNQAPKRAETTGVAKPKEIKTGLTPPQEIQILRRILTPIDNLGNHGYVPEIPAEEAVRRAREGKEAAQGWEKCDRCMQRFQVFPGRRSEDGALTSGGTCNFHWGKAYVPSKSPGDRTRVSKRYICCGEAVGDSAGCKKNDFHVFKAGDARTLAAVLNFENTPENANIPADRAVGFDCEMAYTVYGMELIRLTAVSWPDGGELLDVLVQPLGEILDLNSRYSGVWPEDMARAQPWTSFDDLVPGKVSEPEPGSEDGEVRKKDIRIVSSPEIARSLLFSLIAPTTPLIGHGLENDLNAVRIVHPVIVDTALLYPHKAGLPYRNGLKQLMDYHLNRKIQQETGPKVVGHDSAEDARAAGELALLKVANEWSKLQRQGWRFENGELVKPHA